MSNLDTFNEITAKVLAACYANFPAPLDCDQNEYISGTDTEPNEIFYETMMWLKKYDYITFWEPELGPRTFYHVQLTEKGILRWVVNFVRHAMRPSELINPVAFVQMLPGRCTPVQLAAAACCKKFLYIQ